MEYKRVFITGGLGFIGSSISEHFLKEGSHITIVDSKISNVIETEYFLKKYYTVEIIQSSISDYFTKGLDISDYDLLIHAASLVGPAGLLNYIGTIGHEIVSSTAKVIQTCLQSHIPLLYFSSAEVYGKSGILSENSDVRVPPYYNARIEYALAKLTCEAMVVNNKTQGLKSVIVRPFNVVGPCQSRAGGFVMPTFVQQALGNKTLTVFGSGRQKRAFLGVRDLVNFIAKSLDGDLFKSEIINVGNPNNATTIELLAIRVIELLGSRSKIEHVDPKSIYGPLYFEAESFEKLPDIKKAMSLGWTPKQSLDEIILETAEYYRANTDTRGADARY